MRDVPNKKIYLDTETTGLSNTKHQILTIALILEDQNHTVHKETLKVKTQNHKEIDPKALEVNQIDIDEHNKESISASKTCKEINKIIRTNGFEDAVIVGHNVSFDIRFIKSLFQEQNISPVLNFENIHDTLILSKQVKETPTDFYNGGYDLESLSEHYGFTTEFHDAMNDTEATRHLYREIQKEL